MDTSGRDGVFGGILDKIIEDLNKSETVVEDKKVSEGKVKKLTEQEDITLENVEDILFDEIFNDKRAKQFIKALKLGDKELAKKLLKNTACFPPGENVTDKDVNQVVKDYELDRILGLSKAKKSEGKVPEEAKDTEDKKIKKLTEDTESFEIMFDDLTEEAQKRFLDFQGYQDPSEGNYDDFPISIVDRETEPEEPIESKINEDDEIDILNDDIQSILDDEYDGVEVLDEAKKKMVSKKGKPLKKGAKVRSRGDCVFPYQSPKVTDNKDHFPINKENQARNALARASQYKSAPPWYKGSLEALVKKVQSAVHAKYPDIKITKASAKPGKE